MQVANVLVIAPILLAALGGCGESEGSTAIPAVLIDSVDGVPPSPGESALLVGPSRACTSDGYLHRVLCFDRETREWSEFGREGSGPGEFRSAGRLLRVVESDSLLGVVDNREGRLQIFTSAGVLRGAFPTPRVFIPISHIHENRVVGLHLAGYPPDRLEQGWIVWLDSGDVVRETILREPPRPGDSEVKFTRAVALEDGTLVAYIDHHRLGHFAPTGEALAEFGPPPELRAPVYPSARDLEDFRRSMRRLTGSGPSEAEVRRRAEIARIPVVGWMHVGPGGTVWVAAARDRVDRSYLDVYRENRFIKSVEVRHRLLNFDISGDTLLVLVERPTVGAEGYVRGFDWYRLPSREW